MTGLWLHTQVPFGLMTNGNGETEAIILKEAIGINPDQAVLTLMVHGSTAAMDIIGIMVVGKDKIYYAN